MWAEIMPVRLLSIEEIRKRKRPNDEGLGCSGLNEVNGVGYSYSRKIVQYTSSQGMIVSHHDIVISVWIVPSYTYCSLLYSIVVRKSMMMTRHGSMCMQARALKARCRMAHREYFTEYVLPFID